MCGDSGGGGGLSFGGVRGVYSIVWILVGWWCFCGAFEWCFMEFSTNSIEVPFGSSVGVSLAHRTSAW